MNLRVLRGQMERRLHKTDDATKDFTESFRVQPNADAAMNLGEMAEEGRKSDEAVHQYALAFMLADPADPAVNRDKLRSKIETLWHQTHDSDAGLGDLMLAAYDKVKPAEKPEPAATPGKP